MRKSFSMILVSCLSILAANSMSAYAASKPNFVLCMADDQGWGDVGYYGHSIVKTPVLDEMAATGLRLDRFYAAAPVCSPTRGSVLTGRHPNRFACFAWGHPLRPQEITVAEALKKAGYATGHFGKWHLGSVQAGSPVSPGGSGFDEWFSSPNFYENNPLMSHKGKVVETQGEGSQVTVDAAVDFIRTATKNDQPFLAVVWFGSPHSPHIALDEDRKLYEDQPVRLQHFLGELTAMDRAIGNLRKELKTLDISDNTLFWYTSDNGALPVGSTGGLSGRKGKLEEGGIRVPAVLEWPNKIQAPRTSSVLAGTVDIFPTLLDIAGVNVGDQSQPLDGISLVPLIEGKMKQRKKPLGFWVHPTRGIPMRSTQLIEEIRKHEPGKAPDSSVQASATKSNKPKSYSEENLPGDAAWIDGKFKLHKKIDKNGIAKFTLYDLENDRTESSDIAGKHFKRVEIMRFGLNTWQRSVIGSLNGKDYRAD